MPSAIPPVRPAYRLAPTEPRVSASTQEAPPCSNPYGWVLPATGMVPTTRSGLASSRVIPIRSASTPPVGEPWPVVWSTRAPYRPRLSRAPRIRLEPLPGRPAQNGALLKTAAVRWDAVRSHGLLVCPEGADCQRDGNYRESEQPPAPGRDQAPVRLCRQCRAAGHDRPV